MLVNKIEMIKEVIKSLVEEGRKVNVDVIKEVIEFEIGEVLDENELKELKTLLDHIEIVKVSMEDLKGEGIEITNERILDDIVWNFGNVMNLDDVKRVISLVK